MPKSSCPATRPTVRQLVSEGVLVRTFDRVQKREIVFHRTAVATAAQRLAEALGERAHADVEDGFPLGEAGRVLGIGRKYAVPLLEHLDTLGVTRRRGDHRILLRVGTAGSSAAGRRSA